MASSIKIRARKKKDVVDFKALIQHPMETGLRKNANTGKTIPAHFIQEVRVEANGDTVMTAYWSGGVSKNPYVSFKYAQERRYGHPVLVGQPRRNRYGLGDSPIIANANLIQPV